MKVSFAVFNRVLKWYTAAFLVESTILQKHQKLNQLSSYSERERIAKSLAGENPERQSSNVQNCYVCSDHFPADSFKFKQI